MEDGFNMNKKIALIWLFASFAFVASASAQTFPSQPIRLLIPAPAGGSADAIARVVMPVAAKHLGQQIIIDSEGGAASIPGTARVARATPDGYTLLFGHVGTQVVNPYVFNSLPYDPEKDFIEVARIAAQALILAVPASSPAKSVKEFVELAKQGKITKYATPPGSGTSAHLAMERLKVAAGINLRHIPFPAVTQAILSLSRDEVDGMFFAYASFVPQLQAGTIRLLGIATSERSPLVPDLPTMTEQGFDVLITSWYGVLVPAGTPKPIVDKLADALNKAMADPEVVKALNAAGTDAFPSKSPEDFTAFVKSERVRYKAVIEAANVPKQ
jgi:tripartite-type tricarboxylate transporter receptor subunit TctC